MTKGPTVAPSGSVVPTSSRSSSSGSWSVRNALYQETGRAQAGRGCARANCWPQAGHERPVTAASPDTKGVSMRRITV
jgi:hypothetical protein